MRQGTITQKSTLGEFDVDKETIFFIQKRASLLERRFGLVTALIRAVLFGRIL
jgi:hypothetical protein